jgi:HlyD family secretion protein
VERKAGLALEAAGIRDQIAALDLERARATMDGPKVSAPADELLAVVFLDAADAKRVEPGAEIRVAPDSVEKARYGSAVGVVVAVSSRPVSPAQAEALLANGALAERLAGSGRAMLVVARLTPADDTATGYRWTTSDGPPGTLTAGTTLTASATVEHRRPVTWFMPALRTLTGQGT